MFVRLGDWIYYNSRGEKSAIYKSKLDGTEKTMVVEIDATYLNSIGDWLYFIGYSPYKGSLMRIKADGTQLGIILDVYAAELIVKDGWMFFTDFGQDHHLYKIRTDGTSLTQLTQEPAYNINLTGDWVVYTDVPYTENETKKASIYKVSLDGTQTSKIIETRFADAEILAVEGWVYYWNDGYGDLDSLRSVNLAGTIDLRILLGHVRLMGVTDKALYMNVSNDTMMSGLVRYDLNGANPLILVKDGAHFEMSLLGDKIIYRDITGQGIRIMNLSGTNNLKFLNE